MFDHECSDVRLCSYSFGISLGIVLGVAAFVLALVASNTGPFGDAMVRLMSSIYYGYAPTFVGALWGLLWGFVEGFVGGMVLIWLYNTIAKKCWECKQMAIKGKR